MKKIFALLFAAILLTALPACNEDNTENDAAYTAQLIGTWSMTHQTEDINISYVYKFTSTGFTYTFESMNIKEMKSISWSVKGAWNVKKEILQLSYDLDSFRANGYTETETKKLIADLEDWNEMLIEQNKKGRAYGYSLKFLTVENQTALQLSTINGYFFRVGN